MAQNTRTALITGITGQDGSYLAECLLKKGYEVHAVIRRSSTFNTSRIDHIYRDPHENPSLKLYYGDLSDASQVSNMIHMVKPSEIYHLGAQSHVRVSFDLPEYSANVTGLGTTRILEAVRQSGLDCRIYQASSSEMFGDSPPPQNEKTPFHPRSPYACAKLYSYWMAKNYRDGYGMYCSNGILFNHESPRRGPTFVTRKITSGIAAILAKKQQVLYLGNLEAKRDWGYAPEYVEAMWKILQQNEPDDYVIGTGESHTVSDFVQVAFSYAGLDADKYIRIDRRYYRPTEVNYLCADSRKAKRLINWAPKISFVELVKIMVDEELNAHRLQPIGEGLSILARVFPHRWWNENLAIDQSDSLELPYPNLSWS